MYAYASGNWLVKKGKEAEFVRMWHDWLEWARDNAEGFKWAKLTRSVDDPRRFVSFSEWESEKARADWREHKRFQDGLESLRAITDEFVGGNYNEEISIQV